MTNDKSRSTSAKRRLAAPVSDEEGSGIRTSRAPFARESGTVIRSRPNGSCPGQDLDRPSQRYSDCLDYVDHACDSSARINRVHSIVMGAMGGNSNDFGSLIKLAKNSAHPDIREHAFRALLEHFSAKDGLLLFIALQAESAEIRHGAVDRMRKDGRTKYLLDLVMKESKCPDTKWHAFCESMRDRFGESFGPIMANAIGCQDGTKRNEATYSLLRSGRKDLLAIVMIESESEDTRRYASDLIKIS